MLSLKTAIELIAIIDQYHEKTIDRIFAVFDLEHLIHPTIGKFNKSQKLNILLKEIKYETRKGAFSESIRTDLLQYMVDLFYRREDDPSKPSFIMYELSDAHYDDRFSSDFPTLALALKRDGYVVKGRTIRKLLPIEIQEAKSESELVLLLSKFNFLITKGHLEQAISNHNQGAWAGANSQFRSFIESLLVEISNFLLPGNKCDTANKAISLLSKSVNPSFLRADLNEIEHTKCDTPFIDGLWKRLHPQGAHPGLSDEDDCTFRYHISIVFSHYLLKRLENRN